MRRRYARPVESLVEQLRLISDSTTLLICDPNIEDDKRSHLKTSAHMHAQSFYEESEHARDLGPNQKEDIEILRKKTANHNYGTIIRQRDRE